jgi:DNA mismatch repair protein MutS
MGHQSRLGSMAMLCGTVAAPFLYYGYKHCCGSNSDEQVPAFLKKIHDRFKNDGDKYFNFIISLFKNKHVTEAGRWCTAFFCALGMKSSGDWIKGNFILLKLLQKRLIDVRSFLDCTQKMHELCVQHPTLSRLCDLLSYIDQDDVAIKTAPEFTLFKNVMQKNTFKDEPSVFSHFGNILSGYKLTYAVKNDLECMIAAVGELDAYVSLATLYKEHEYTSVQYCFAEFIESDTPVLMMEQAWNPFVDVEHVVANDIMFGDSIPTHAIVTGPNAGGKSTILKGGFINVLLAQSIGLVSASKCMLTPFSYMATYMNITDDIVAGKSLFKAEVERAHDLLEHIKKMPQHDFSFIVMDEIFSGTNPKEGQAAAYSVAKHIGNFNNVVCWIATHYDLLTQLEQFDSFVNFHVSVQKRTDGFHYPFMLKQGISNQHIALDILQDDGFASDIVDTARAVIAG